MHRAKIQSTAPIRMAPLSKGKLMQGNVHKAEGREQRERRGECSQTPASEGSGPVSESKLVQGECPETPCQRAAGGGQRPSWVGGKASHPKIRCSGSCLAGSEGGSQNVQGPLLS